MSSQGNRSLLDECTALYRLVGDLKSCIDRNLSESSYPKGTEDFLFHTGEAALKTQAHIRKGTLEFLEESDPSRVQEYRDRLAHFWNAWVTLHNLVKPLTDACSLRIPYPLVRFIGHQIGQIDELKGARILVGMTPEMNYYQHRHKRIRDVLRNLRSIIAQRTEFEKCVGFVSLPYSQSGSLFVRRIQH